MKTFTIIVALCFLFSVVFASQCTDEDRSLVKADVKFHDKLSKCAKATWGKKDATTACIRKKIVLGKECADCFGAVVACGAKKCLTKCSFNPDSASCISCSKKKCQPTLAECSGIPIENLPNAQAPAVERVSESLALATQCSDDERATLKADTQFHDELRSCAKATWGKKDATTACIRKKIVLGKECADCFGAVVACGAKKCFTKCSFNPDSASCISCTKKECQPALAECSGIPIENLPNARKKIFVETM